MRLVIDSNRLRTPQLRDFLAKSPNNVAVLPDFVAMEAHGGETLVTIFESMQVLSDFPDQVLILKGSAAIFGMSGRRKGLQRRLVDEGQTKHFPEYVRALRLAKAGDTRLRNELLTNGMWATEHLEKMRLEAASIRTALQDLGGLYSKEERAVLRTKEEYTPELIDKLVQAVLELVGHIIRDSPLLRRRPTYAELPNTFPFRVTLACYLLGMRKAASGALSSLPDEKLRNDFVDMMVVAYGTFFDGVMSGDRNVNYMHTEVGLLLSALLDADVPSLANLRRSSRLNA